MAWVVGMADDENPDAGAARGKKRKKQKASKSKLFDEQLFVLNASFIRH